MFGNVMNNTQIKKAIERGELNISPFNESNMDIMHYQLFADAIFDIKGRKEDGRSDIELCHDITRGESFSVRPNGYHLVRVAESIVMSEFIVAQFCTPFHMIDNGFSVTHGRVQHPFGKMGQRLIIGVSNMLPQENVLDLKKPIAYIYFIDFRGMDNAKITLTLEEINKFKLWSRRYTRARDDGPFYE